MSREMKTKTIDKQEYACTQFPPQKSLRILTKITRYIGEPLAVLLDSDRGLEDVMERDVSDLNIGEAIMKFGKNLGDDDLYNLCKDVCESVLVDMTQIKDNTFDQHFTGPQGLKKMFQVTAFALEVNYGDFLGGAVANLGNLKGLSAAK